jgi:cellulose synthase/poly-beta-1,6-N-acetylglucosamine synthase-like glycosyltransferase
MPAPATSLSTSGIPIPGTPRVSVIVPAFGVAPYLREALASLQRQTLQEWEAVVIDDGDPAVAKVVTPFLADPRIRFLATANHGVSPPATRPLPQPRPR